MIPELAVVELTKPIPSDRVDWCGMEPRVEGLIAGDVGTVVHVHAAGEAYMVECCKFDEADGARGVLVDVTPDELRVLRQHL